MGFDAHMIDIYPTLMSGATLYVFPSEMRLDIEAMNTYFCQNSISIAFLTTQVGYLLASSIKNSPLRMLSVGGEKLPPMQNPPITMMNCYGPTEATIAATFHLIHDNYQEPIIGKAIPNIQLYVVDNLINLLPQGIAGELLIGGEGLSRGYLHPSDKDAARFLTFKGERYYRTGDLCRWNEHGELEYLGRIDTQVKLRGFRIELGEIESQALKYDGIKQAVATVHDEQLLCLFPCPIASRLYGTGNLYATGNTSAHSERQGRS